MSSRPARRGRGRPRGSRNKRKGKMKSKSKARSQFIKMFPKKQLVQLTYCDTVNVPSINGGSSPYKFRLNSINDPDYTATGHQPRGHDQWALIYKRYTVVGAQVRIEPLVNPYTSTSANTTLFCYVDDDSNSDQYNIAELTELGMPKTTHKYVELGAARYARNHQNPDIKFNIGMKKFFGISKDTQVLTAQALGQGESQVISDPYGLTANFSANPSNVCWLKIHNETADGTEFPLKCRVTIKYLCVCHDPIEVTSS